MTEVYRREGLAQSPRRSGSVPRDPQSERDVAEFLKKRRPRNWHLLEERPARPAQRREGSR